MESILAILIFQKKNKIKSYFLGSTVAIVLLIVGTPLSVIGDVISLFYKADYMRAIKSTMWLINRSYLKINQLGLNYSIGEVLSKKSRKSLYKSRFTKNSGKEEIDKGWLIISALVENPEDSFWIKEFNLIFKGYKGKINSFSQKRETENIPKKFVVESDALEALDELTDLFTNQPKGFFLVSGTFLGLIREKKFLGHDYDIDIGCFSNEFDVKVFLETLNKSKNFYLKELCYFFNDRGSETSTEATHKASSFPYTIKLLHKTYITIDIFIHFEENEKCIHGSGIHLWSNEKFDLKEYTFYGRQCLGPADYDKYLEENYGEWRIEKKDFDCDTGTPNLIFPQTPQAYLYLLEHYQLSKH